MTDYQRMPILTAWDVEEKGVGEEESVIVREVPLPEEMAMRVFGWVDPGSLVRCELVCRSWRQALTDLDSPLLHWLWRRVQRRRLGSRERTHREVSDIRQSCLLSMLYYQEKLSLPSLLTSSTSSSSSSDSGVGRVRSDLNFRAALVHAVRNHHNIVVRKLVSQPGIDWEKIIEHPYAESLIDVAARAGNELALRMLASKGGPITKTTFELVLRSGLSSDVMLWLFNSVGESRLTGGNNEHDPQTLQHILTKLNTDVNTVFLQAAQIECVELMSCLLAQLPTDKARQELLMATDSFTGRTLLHRACSQGLTRTFIFLLEQFPQALPERSDFINKQGNQGETALMLAIGRNDAFMAERLLSAGADCTVRTRSGETSLHLAVANLNLEMACMLLNRGAVPYAAKDYGSGDTPLSLALSNLCTSQDPDAATLERKLALAKQLLITGGELSCKAKAKMIDIVIRQFSPSEPLVTDDQNWREQAVLSALTTLFETTAMDWRSLLAEVTRTKQYSRLMCSIAQASTAVLRYLIRQGLSQSKEKGSQWLLLPLLDAQDHQVVDKLKLLLVMGVIDANMVYYTEEDSHMSPIHIVSLNASTHEIIELLLLHGADINCLDGGDRTVLHYHMEQSRGRLSEEYLWFLKQKGFDFSRRYACMSFLDYWRYLYPSSGPQILLTELVRESQDVLREKQLISR